MNTPLSICILSTALWLLPFQAQASKPGTPISGFLCDSLSRQTDPFAPIRLLNINLGNRIVASTRTDVNGYFQLNAPSTGAYTLEALITGKRPLRRQLTITQTDTEIKLDTLLTSEYTNTLNEATITAQKVVVKNDIDKITYSAADDPDALGKSTLDILRKVPMVTVDGQDKIQINGNASFKVYVNGKPNHMMSSNPSEILKSYPASNIQKIEVITNPGAKYDAEGTAGVLNIITKKQTSLTGIQFIPALQVSNKDVIGGFWTIAQFGKFALSANYAYGKRKNYTTYSSQERESFNDPINHLWNAFSTEQANNILQWGQLEASYEFSEKDLLNISAGLKYNKQNSQNNTQTKMFDSDGMLRYGYRLDYAEKIKSYDLNTSVDFQHQFNDTQRLTLSYLFNHNPLEVERTDRYNLEPESVQELTLNDIHACPNEKSIEHTAQADYSIDFNTKHSLSTGLKYIHRLNRSNYTEWNRPAGTEQPFILNDLLSLRYRHRSDIGAAYVEYILKLKKWSLQTGNRVEMFRARVDYPDGKRESFSTTQTNWVPQIAIAFMPSDNSQLRANYNMRINRPGIDMLSPHQTWKNPEYVVYGNPKLSNTTMHNLGLNYSFFKPNFTLNTSLNYAFSNNEVVQYSFLDGHIQHSTCGNFLHSKVTSLSVYIQGKLSKTTSYTINTTGKYTDYKSHKTNERNSGFQTFLNASARQQLPLNFSINFWGGYGSEGVWLQGHGSRWHYYGLSVEWRCLKEQRLEFQLAINNFAQKHLHNRESKVTSQFRLNIHNYFNPINFALAIRYRLGNIKEGLKKVRKSIENTDIRSNNQQNKGMGNM